ncbi:DUF2493 domain-containing protein [Bradyrhizobium oropedii]|uniref:DUF2493 domain-containing protein n=1 Tax=Bradyrhizobium oropedii TaxID=1571201 RepID=UPI003B846AC2
MEQRVLVCGGRDYSDREQLYRVLDAAHLANPVVLLVHGGASGADDLAGRWARHVGVSWKAYPAEWKSEGRSAGPRRNQRMLDETKPHLVIAFPGGRGTADMISKAELAGVPVVRVRRRQL